MKNGLSDLLLELDRLSWDDLGRQYYVHKEVENIMRRWWVQAPRLYCGLREHLEMTKLPTITRTAELHSWMLHEGGPYCLKLNQFIPSPLTGRTSENIHDHTRPLTTLTLTGSYTSDYYNPDLPRFPIGSDFMPSELNIGERLKTIPGYVYTITPDQFHALADFDDGTLTLCLYGRIVKDQITVFNTVSGRVETRSTCNFAREAMIQQLGELENSSL